MILKLIKKIGSEISLAKVFNTRGSLRGEKVSQLKVALSQKILENFYISNINTYSKFLSCAENLNFPPKTVNNSFKLSTQDSNLEYLCWRRKNFPVSSDLSPVLLRKYCLLMTLLPNFLVNFLGIFLIRSI